MENDRCLHSFSYLFFYSRTDKYNTRIFVVDLLNIEFIENSHDFHLVLDNSLLAVSNVISFAHAIYIRHEDA